MSSTPWLDLFVYLWGQIITPTDGISDTVASCTCTVSLVQTSLLYNIRYSYRQLSGIAVVSMLSMAFQTWKFGGELEGRGYGVGVEGCTVV